MLYFELRRSKKREQLKSTVSTLTEEILKLKDLIQQRSSSATPSAKETTHSLELTRKEYDEFLRFKTVSNKELQRLNAQLTEVKAKVDAIGHAIDTFQENSFQYNRRCTPGESRRHGIIDK